VGGLIWYGMVLLRVDCAIKVCSSQQTTASNYKSEYFETGWSDSRSCRISVSFHVDLNIYIICLILGFLLLPLSDFQVVVADLILISSSVARKRDHQNTRAIPK